MKKSLLGLACLTLLLALASCSGMSFTVESYDDLILGNWEMTSCYYMYADSTREDVAPDNLMYTYFKDHTFVTTDEDGYQYVGKYKVKNEELIVTMNDESITYHIEDMTFSRMEITYTFFAEDDELFYVQTMIFYRI